jgi:hypothetical protein
MSRASLVALVLFSLLCSSAAYTFAPDGAELKAAVELWTSDEAAARKDYGDISTDWDTGNVTGMRDLFSVKGLHRRSSSTTGAPIQLGSLILLSG